MGDYAENFVFGEQIHESGVYGYGGVGGVPTGSKGVGAWVVNDVDLGLGDICALGEDVYHLMKFGGFLGGDFLRAGHFKGKFVAVPVGTNVHKDGDGECNNHSGVAADGLAHEDEESGESGE